jgi:ribosomal subunit interface protein
MKVTVTGRHIDVGQALRQHVEDGLDGIVSKYFDNAMDATVTFEKQQTRFETDISVRIGRGILIQGRADADEPYAAFNTAADHIAKRLRRYKRRLRDHHNAEAREVEALQAQQYILTREEEAGDGDDSADAGEPAVVAEMPTDIETLTVGEAVMRMDLADAPALMFRNAAHGGLNMVYRRTDGNIGWVDPRGLRERTQ